MNVVKNKRYIYLVLVIVIITCIFIVSSKMLDKETKLEEVKLKDELNEVSKNSFAIMVEKEDGSGYEEADSFPSDMTLNPNLSGCIDEEGKTINGSLAYKDGKVSVHVNSTAYCYLYFYKDEETPIVTASVRNNETENAKMVITSSESGTYCINKSSTVEDMSSCVFEGTIYGGVSLTTDVFTNNGTYYVHVQDGAGNVGISVETKVVVTLTEPLINYFINNDISGLQKQFIGTDTLYRFSGINGNNGINNYICLGVTEKCSSGSANMYRIIGVEPSTGYIKVIKQTKYTTTKWSSGSSATWATSTVYTTMNTTWFGSITFADMIIEHTWNIKTFSSAPTTRTSAYSSESGSTINAYVGMMSLVDYYLAYNNDQNWYDTSSNYASNWMHIVNNGTKEGEWTMSLRSTASQWYVDNSGMAGGSPLSSSYAVRPTFYLKETVKRLSGSGTIDDPFIVELS